ncbi:XdhC family protein [Arthrobacter sp. D1-29]
MLDLIPSLNGWTAGLPGNRCAVATIVHVSGSVPRPVGTSMLISESGAVLGSLSGGCVEGAVVALAFEAMNDGATRLERFGYSAADAFAVGLTCGGELEVHIEALAAEGTRPDAGVETLQHLRGVPADGPVAVIRRVDANGRGLVVVHDPGTFQVARSAGIARLLELAPDTAPNPTATGRSITELSTGSTTGTTPERSTTPDDALLSAAAQLEPLLRGGRTGLVRLAPPNGCTVSPSGVSQGHSPAPELVTLLVESRLPPPRLLVFGANDFSAALVPAAKLLGYRVTLVDARPAFASQARFRAADDVVTDWPHRYLAAEAAAGHLDPRTVICVLTHDPKFDIPLLEAALALDVAFVGALGSRRSHLQRVDALLAARVPPEQIAQLHSPLGLDLGAVTPAEVAVSVAAEIIAARNPAASHQPLRETAGPIHQALIHQAPDHQQAAARPAPNPLVPNPLVQQETAWT